MAEQNLIEMTHETGATLGAHDIVGTTFYIALNAMLACTIFFFQERDSVPRQWRKSITVAMLVTGIATWNYLFMKTTWIKTQNSPTVYRYTDWLITVPLQIVEFYLILAATGPVSSSLFYKLLSTSVIMLVGGYLGEIGAVSVLCGFAIGMAGWLYIVYEIFAGECSGVAAGSSKSSQMAFNSLRQIVSIGWIIYPLGYYLVYLGPTFSYHSQSVINIVYNIADLVNKGAFGLCIWAAAKEDARTGKMPASTGMKFVPPCK